MGATDVTGATGHDATSTCCIRDDTDVTDPANTTDATDATTSSCTHEVSHNGRALRGLCATQMRQRSTSLELLLGQSVKSSARGADVWCVRDVMDVTDVIDIEAAESRYGCQR